MVAVFPAAAAPAPSLLGRDYWLIWSVPSAGTAQAAIDAHAAEHVHWLLALERDHIVVLSGPLLAGPGTAAGSGVTVLRARDAATAEAIAAQDPFVRAGLRTFQVFQWRVNEGSIGIRLSLGAGTFDWQ